MTTNKSSKRSSAPMTVVISNDQQSSKTTKKILKSKDILLSPRNKKKRRMTENLPNDTSHDRQTLINPINIEQKQQSLSTDNLVTLLTQGLQSNDLILLDEVLSCPNDKIIEKTVQRIPNSILLPLIDCLNKYLYLSAERGLIASKWLRAILNIHSSYLMTYSDITERLGPMYELIESRTKIYPNLARLHGKLSLIASQINSHKTELSNNDIQLSTKPSLIFEDVSDEDFDGDQTQDELILSPSEYDDYSGLSDDLDLGIHDDDNDGEIIESDTDINFQYNGHTNDDSS